MKKIAALVVCLLPCLASAQSVSDLIIAYLAKTSISWSPGDWSTCQPEGQADGICTWNTAKLGPIPDASQLAAAATYWTNQQQAKQFGQVLAGGITVTCAPSATVCTSSNEGTYAVDENAQLKISAIQVSITGGYGLPGGGTTFLFKDVNGIGHAFTAQQFVEFSIKARDFYYGASVTEAQLLAGQAASWPASSVQLP